MYLMYVDESGDPGITGSPTRYFALSGFVVHELRWRQTLDQLIEFRRHLKRRFNFSIRGEFHAPRLLSRPGKLIRIPKHERILMIRHFTVFLAKMPDVMVIRVLVDKSGRATTYDPFVKAWQAIVQRFENTISHHNFLGPQNPDDKGMVFSDNTDAKKLTSLIRRMRRHNPIPSQAPYQADGASPFRILVLTRIVEDPSFRDSGHSLFIQVADLTAFLLYQYHAPSTYMRRVAAHKFFERLDPILCKKAASNQAHGIVKL